MSDEPQLKPHITLIEGRVTTTSMMIAQHFGKRHAHVLRAIESAMTELPPRFNEPNFGLVTYRDSKGEIRPMYRLSRDGFALIAMGFTGKRAMQWKVAYINAFNAMEEALRRRSEPPAQPRIKATPAMPPVPHSLERLIAGDRDAHLFLALFYALGRDDASASLLWYLLHKGAHVTPYTASIRHIRDELNEKVSRGAVCNSANRLVARGLLEITNGLGHGMGPTTYFVLLQTLFAQLQLLRGDSFPGLADFVSQNPGQLLH